MVVRIRQCDPCEWWCIHLIIFGNGRRRENNTVMEEAAEVKPEGKSQGRVKSKV